MVRSPDRPDFATLVIDYVPKGWMVEVQVLKLYLNSSRNTAVFHEDCTLPLRKKIVELLEPRWLASVAISIPRGGRD